MGIIQQPNKLVKYIGEKFRDKKGIRAIDLGCASGRNAIYLADLGFKVTGVDNSYEAINRAKETSNKVDWYEADLLHESFPYEYFDIILASGFLHCLPTHQDEFAVIKKMKTATKEVGVNLLANWVQPLSDFSIKTTGSIPFKLSHLSMHKEKLTLNDYLQQYNAWQIIADESQSDFASFVAQK
jgi:trans-aconitate methyltransferase